MTPDQERWAEAIGIHRIRGEKAAQHVAAQIGALAVLGDQGGIDRWMAIKRRLDALKSGALQRLVRRRDHRRIDDPSRTSTASVKGTVSSVAP